MNDKTTHGSVYSDLAGYALDALDEAARSRVEQHLAECDECAAEIQELLEAAGSLAFAVAPVEPPADLMERIKAAVATEPVPMAVRRAEPSTAEEIFGRSTAPEPATRYATAAGLPMTPPERARWYTSRRLAWGVSAGIAAAFIGVLAASAVVNVRLNDRIDELSGEVAAQERDVASVSASVSAIESRSQQALNEVQQVSALQEAADTLEQQVNDLRWLQYVTSTGDWLTPSFFSGGLQPQAPQGMLITHASGDRALLMVNGLAPAPTGSVYQVWLTYEGRQVPGSTFTVDRNGYAVVDLDLSGDATEYIGASVTVEPAGGSLAPSDFVVLIGSSN